MMFHRRDDEGDGPDRGVENAGILAEAARSRPDIEKRRHWVHVVFRKFASFPPFPGSKTNRRGYIITGFHISLFPPKEPCPCLK
jgi:hypothetical protein